MSHLLLIDLPTDPAGTVDWLLWDGHARKTAAGGSLAGLDALSELQGYSRQYTTYVIVPGEHVSHFRVTLPTAGHTAQSALPYQLEEHLCSDLDRQHISNAKIVANRPVSAVVTDRTLMRRWADALQRAELRVEAMVPDYLLMEPDSVLLCDQRAVVFRGDHRATLDRDNLAQWWSMTGTEQEGEVNVIQAVEPGDWLPEPHRVSAVDSRLQGLALTLREPPLSMLHGEFKLHDPVRDHLRLWRRPAIAAAAVLLLHWAVLGLEAVKLKREQTRIDEAIEQVYRETFPQTQRVVNARSQMRSQLQSMERSGGGAALLNWLEYTALALKDRGDVELKQIHYQQQPQTLRLSVNAPDYAAVDGLTQALNDGDITVERGTFNRRDNAIDGQILIKGGG